MLIVRNPKVVSGLTVLRKMAIWGWIAA